MHLYGSKRLSTGTTLSHLHPSWPWSLSLFSLFLRRYLVCGIYTRHCQVALWRLYIYIFFAHFRISETSVNNLQAISLNQNQQVQDLTSTFFVHFSDSLSLIAVARV